MKLVFTNVPSRHNSAQVIQKRLKFKRVVITFRLAYHNYFLMDLK